MFLQSILVYSSLMSVMILFGISASRKKNYNITNEGLIQYHSFWRFDTIIPLLLFAVIFGMRYDVGVDHLGYLDKYLGGEYAGKNEPLFHLFSDIGWSLNLHYVVYFAVLAFAQVFFFFYAFKDQRYLYPLLTFFIFTNGTIGFWMNGIRQGIAMCVWIYSLRYIDSKKITPYLIWGVIAVLFHKSAIILFVFYPILRNGKDYFKNITLQLVFFASTFIIKEIFSQVIMQFESVINFYISLLGDEVYMKYYNVESLMQSFSDRQGTGLAYLFIIGVNIIVILFSKKLKQYYNNKWFNMMYFLFFIGLITSYMFPSGAISLKRPFQYFYIFQSIMYAYFGYYLYKNKEDGSKLILLLLLIISFSGIFFLSQYTATENSHSLFQFYFQNNINGYPK
ncbi:MAG TPA: EpsG family protein [Gallicola sp.]|nr:EpsG family protein [Gallicola sp.]